MKNLFFTATTLMLVLLSVSCSKDEPKTPVVPASFEYECIVAFEKDLLDMVDITMLYIDEAGEQKSEAVNTIGEIKYKNDSTELVVVTPSISKTVKAAKIPYTGGTKFIFKLKASVPEKPLYTARFAGSIGYTFQPDADTPSPQQNKTLQWDIVSETSKEGFIERLQGIFSDHLSRSYRAEKTSVSDKATITWK